MFNILTSSSAKQQAKESQQRVDSAAWVRDARIEALLSYAKQMEAVIAAGEFGSVEMMMRTLRKGIEQIQPAK